ncbi:hypothetical protein CUMW_057930 [Citrus unshiu]|nr:hypothetical protein CUMW_057930 [Citrus unshiu]
MRRGGWGLGAGNLTVNPCFGHRMTSLRKGFSLSSLATSASNPVCSSYCRDLPGTTTSRTIKSFPIHRT